MNAFTIALFLLSVYLVSVYLQDYMELKSSFTLGLILVLVSFMIFALTSNPMLHMFFGVYGRMSLFSLIPYLFATISLAILAWISSK